MISFESVHFGYGETLVLRSINLALQPKELISIVGPNGAGKSTLLRLAAGLLKPQQGRVCLRGIPTASLARADIAKDLSFLPQHVELAFPFAVRDVVLMGRYAHQSRWSLSLESDTDRNIAKWAMEKTHVAHLADRIFSDISGGEKRRVLVAQALCQKSPIVLLDEPTAALDPKHAHQVLSY